MYIDVKSMVAKAKESLKKEIDEIGDSPQLVILLANDNLASRVYINNKLKVAKEVGIDAHLIEFPKTSSNEHIIEVIETLNKDECFHGIIMQMPVYEHLNADKIINAIDPKKDVDGLTKVNEGKLFADDNPYHVPCTAAGVMDILFETEEVRNPRTGDFGGKHVAIVGRSRLVGYPLMKLLLRYNATVSVIHSHTSDDDKEDILSGADIIITAIGEANWLDGRYIDFIKPQTIIDVGINKADDKIVGDALNGLGNSHWIKQTPVPGGVGLMTTFRLMYNTLEAYKLLKG